MEKENQKIYDEWSKLSSEREKYHDILLNQFIEDFNRDAYHFNNSVSKSKENIITNIATRISTIFHKRCNYAPLLKMIENEVAKNGPLTEEFILNLHRKIFKKDFREHIISSNGLEYNIHVHVGVYKKYHNSFIPLSGPIYYTVSPEETPLYMTELIKWYNKYSTKSEYNGIELASLFYYKYVSIHPFDDGNGRTVRLLISYILLSHGFPMIIFPVEMRNYYLYCQRFINQLVGYEREQRMNVTTVQMKIFTEFIEDLVAEQMQKEIEILKGR